MMLARRAGLAGATVTAAAILAFPACTKQGARESAPPAATSQTGSPSASQTTSQQPGKTQASQTTSQSAPPPPTASQQPPPPAADPWEEARRSGVGFRAVGRDPGWFLEITEGTGVLFVTNYGVERHEFGAPSPGTIDEHAKQSVCRARSESLEVVVVVDSLRCLDPMTGYAFQWSVQVILGGKTYRGCGRTLKDPHAPAR